MSESLVSIIIPTFNRADTIEKSVRSCMRQSYKNLEIIVSDDGSSDGTKDLIESLMHEDDRIKYILNDTNNHGPSANRNFAVSKASGKYICFNDSDDEFRFDKVKKQLDKLIDNDADVNFCVKIKGKTLSPWRDFNESELNTQTILYKCFTGTQCLLGKAQIFRDEPFDEMMNCNEDWELCIRLTSRHKMSFLNEVLVDVDDTVDSVGSSSLRGSQMMRYIMSKHRELYNEYPYAKQKMLAQIKYADAVSRDEEKHTVFTKIARYVAFLKVVK